jgi:hypothetical protein
MIETDGPYAGYTCSNASHIHHHGIGDSVYMVRHGNTVAHLPSRKAELFVPEL